MIAQPPRSYTTLAVAVVVAALITGSATYLALSPGGKVSTITITSPVTLTTTIDNSTIISTLNASCDTSSTLHCVVFQQLGACSNPEFWGEPWSVTIGGMTEVQPEGTPLPLNNGSLAGTLNRNLTVIVFSLPDGDYQFRVSPSYEFFTPDSGRVDVNGTDVLVQIAYTGTSCTAVVTTSTSAASVTGTSVDTSSDTYLTTCSVTGVGGLQLRVLSDSSGAPVSGEVINAVDRLGCEIVGQAGETQVVHLDNFSVEQGGWLTPLFPNQATPGGQLSFTVTYQGETYNFSAGVPPIGTSCVTLHVPSGNITTTTVMNGQGSYCWQ